MRKKATKGSSSRAGSHEAKGIKWVPEKKLLQINEINVTFIEMKFAVKTS